MTQLLEMGFIDSYRYLYPDREDAYTWWSYMARARERNIGWRIDYFILSKDLQEKIKATDIHSAVLGSDHCPIGVEVDVAL